MKYLDKDGLTYAWSKIKAKIDAKPDLDKIYPIGSIYMTMASSNPGDLFGGTWTKLSGGYLYANTSNAGSTGGSHEINVKAENLPSHSHSYTRVTGTQGTAISTNQMPYHAHGVHKTGQTESGRNDWGLVGAGAYGKNVLLTYGDSASTESTGGNGSHNHGVNTGSYTTGATGSGKSITFYPEYINVYMWQRTA